MSQENIDERGTEGLENNDVLALERELDDLTQREFIGADGHSYFDVSDQEKMDKGFTDAEQALAKVFPQDAEKLHAFHELADQHVIQGEPGASWEMDRETRREEERLKTILVNDRMRMLGALMSVKGSRSVAPIEFADSLKPTKKISILKEKESDDE
jgi:hypothetical protein